MGTAKIWADRQDIPGHSSELQGVWLAPTQDTPRHRRHLSPEAPCSLSQALKIKLPGRSYSGLRLNAAPGKKGALGFRGRARGEARTKGGGGSAPTDGASALDLRKPRLPAQRRWPGHARSPKRGHNSTSQMGRRLQPRNCRECIMRQILAALQAPRSCHSLG